MAIILGISCQPQAVNLALIGVAGGKLVAHAAWDYSEVSAIDLTTVTTDYLAKLVTNYREVEVVALAQPEASAREATAPLYQALLAMCTRLGLAVQVISPLNVRRALCPTQRATLGRQYKAAVLLAGEMTSQGLVPAIGAAWHLRQQLNVGVGVREGER